MPVIEKAVWYQSSYCPWGNSEHIKIFIYVALSWYYILIIYQIVINSKWWYIELRPTIITYYFKKSTNLIAPRGHSTEVLDVESVRAFDMKQTDANLKNL